jgi:hypothetical protein
MNANPTREQYGGKLPYDMFISNAKIASASIFLLIEIQCKKPSYNLQYALLGCTNPGFGGYPLDEDATNKQGIEYIACAVSSIRTNDLLWNQTSFFKTADAADRIKVIIKLMLLVSKQVINDDIIQSRLSDKRKYLSESTTLHNSAPKDMIYSTFLPEQILVKPEDAAKDVITPEVAQTMGNNGRIALVKLWIRQAHLHAKEHAILIRGSPRIETSCCMEKIESPGIFWKNIDTFPEITKRVLNPRLQGHALVTEFIPRDSGSGVVEPDKDLYYRIFLKYCFQGERMGYVHQPGVTNKCISCGFQFPSHPSIMDSDTEGKAALSSQEVKTTSADFTNLLDKIHTVYGVTAIKSAIISPIDKIMGEFGLVEPSPLLNWASIIDETTKNFQRLAPDADKGDIVLAASTISNAYGDSESFIKSILKAERLHIIMDSISELSWLNFFQVLQIYFITPFQRLLSKFNRNSLFIPIEMKNALSETHTTQDLEPILVTDLEIIKLSEDEFKGPKMALAQEKIAYYLKQVSALLPYKNKIRKTVVPGGSLSLTYIQKALFYGPIATLMKPVGKEVTPMKFIAKFIIQSLDKYNKEKLSYSDKDLKDLIAIRDEKERVNVVKEFNKLTDEERGMELMNKKLGIGKWAVGGTKLIYAYDKDYYDLERQKRLNAGIMDFPGLGNSDVPQGRQMDEFGFPTSNDNELDSGYDNNQHGDDDNE